jgi:hypothetical protein
LPAEQVQHQSYNTVVGPASKGGKGTDAAAAFNANFAVIGHVLLLLLPSSSC